MESEQDQDALSTRLRANDVRGTAPAGLHARVRAEIAAARRPKTGGWMRMAAACAAVSAVVAVVVTVVSGNDPDRALIGDYTAAHAALAAPGDLKPLFARTLPFRPPVVDAAEVGCSLTGGRVAKVRSQDMAALDYACGGQAVTVYVTASADGAAAPQAGRRDGYQLVSWRGRSLACRAVSRGADPGTLLRLAAFIQQRAQAA